jgi:hypothetical protein
MFRFAFSFPPVAGSHVDSRRACVIVQRAAPTSPANNCRIALALELAYTTTNYCPISARISAIVAMIALGCSVACAFLGTRDNSVLVLKQKSATKKRVVVGVSRPIHCHVAVQLKLSTTPFTKLKHKPLYCQRAIQVERKAASSITVVVIHQRKPPGGIHDMSFVREHTSKAHARGEVKYGKCNGFRGKGDGPKAVSDSPQSRVAYAGQNEEHGKNGMHNRKGAPPAICLLLVLIQHVKSACKPKQCPKEPRPSHKISLGPSTKAQANVPRRQTQHRKCNRRRWRGNCRTQDKCRQTRRDTDVDVVYPKQLTTRWTDTPTHVGEHGEDGEHSDEDHEEKGEKL